MKTRALLLTMLICFGCQTESKLPSFEREPADSPGARRLKIPSKKTFGPAPMTGLVLWNTNEKIERYAKAISLEFSYFSFADVVRGSAKKGYVYDWTPVTRLFAEAKARGHHVILRFRDTDPELTAPGLPEDLNIKKITAEYDENIPGVPNKRKVHFPDWSNPALAKFHKDFFAAFAKKFADEKALAFLQVGFGLWGEYHLDFDNLRKISDPSITSVATALGKIFPSKNDQLSILKSIEASFKANQVGVSIDAADGDYTDFAVKESWRRLAFGLFDDSFLASAEKESAWSVFPDARKRLNGGEISYYNENDQREALSPHGPNGVSLAAAAKERALTYLIGNGQTEFHGPERIAAAGKLMGYSLKIESALAEGGRTVVTVQNVGAAPIHYNVYAEIGGVTAQESLYGLGPGQRKTLTIAAEGEPGTFRFRSPALYDGEVIAFTGN